MKYKYHTIATDFTNLMSFALWSETLQLMCKLCGHFYHWLLCKRKMFGRNIALHFVFQLATATLDGKLQLFVAEWLQPDGETTGRSERIHDLPLRQMGQFL